MKLCQYIFGALNRLLTNTMSDTALLILQNVMVTVYGILNSFTYLFLFSHLADAFIQSDLQMRTL